MENKIFETDRYFTLWDYQVSHGQLLLRSDKRKGYDTNIDIIFFNSQYVELFTVLDGIKIISVDKSIFSHHVALKKCLSFDSVQLFQLESAQNKFLVAAYFVKIYKNNLEYYESSLGPDNDIRGEEIVS